MDDINDDDGLKKAKTTKKIEQNKSRSSHKSKEKKVNQVFFY